jgi:hypothetical protein
MVPPRKSKQAQANAERKDTHRLTEVAHWSIAAAKLSATRNCSRSAIGKSARGAWVSGTAVGVWNRCAERGYLGPPSFKPEYAVKMNFYLSAVDDLLRHPDDKPSIGIILCKSKNKVIAEYALRNLAKPVGISNYVTKLVESLPAKLSGNLPGPEDLEVAIRKSDHADGPTTH